ncbi:MAG TPA: CBS domain-containing protein, partial [Thermoplasmata archaeon]
GVPIAYAARLMKRANLRHLAVFNGREIVGVLSAYDFMKALGGYKDLRGLRDADLISPSVQ